MTRRGRLRLKEEKGIATVIVAVSLIGIFSSALMSLDFGNMWTTRRTIISGTDATALDQAIFAGRTGATDCNRFGGGSFNPAYQDWTNILQLNTSGFVTGSQTCTFTAVNSGGIIGYVGVDARKEAKTRFGALFNLGSSQPYSYSAARVYYPDAIEGLRPIGICIHSEHIQEWLDYLNSGTPMPSSGSDHPSYQGATLPVHRITYDNSANAPCGNAPGNWGYQDFDGDDGGNSSEEFKEWMLEGYDGLVNAPSDCDNDGSGVNDQPGGVGDQCPGNPGNESANDNQNCNNSSLSSVLGCIKSIPGSPPTIKEFPIVIFDSADCTTGGGGGGNNCKYNVVRYVIVRLWGFRLTGADSSRYFDFEFVPGIATGPCCDTSPNQTDIKAVQLCAVDHDVSGLTPAQRCATG
ncbi:MAG: TadE/TadG family type IV pilus assembly protein [Actinomycetota bacterium]